MIALNDAGCHNLPNLSECNFPDATLVLLKIHDLLKPAAQLLCPSFLQGHTNA